MRESTVYMITFVLLCSCAVILPFIGAMTHRALTHAGYDPERLAVFIVVPLLAAVPAFAVVLLCRFAVWLFRRRKRGSMDPCL